MSLTLQEGGLENHNELGNYLHLDFQKQGIMKGVVGTVLRYGFQEKGVHSVDVKIREDNLSSRKIIDSIPEFKLINGGTMDAVKWPTRKGGGGSKTLLVWRIVVPDGHALP